MRRLLTLSLMLFVVVLELSCSGGGIVEDSGANVYLVVTQYNYNNYDVPVCDMMDVTLQTIEITSRPVRPADALNDNDDVIIDRWVVTPTRLDGGQASPVWTTNFDFHVPADGNATLSNHTVYPYEYFLEEPLINLFPENGGFDPETGQTNIRQSLKIEFFGQTVSGDRVSAELIKEFNFICR